MDWAPHTVKTTIDVLWGAPAAVYKGGGEEAAGLGGAPWGGVPPLAGSPLSPPMAHVGPLLPRGVPVTPRYSEIYPNHSKTIPVYEYYRPIYQSLTLDHFETPRHVRDLIRDSEQSSVHQNV